MDPLDFLAGHSPFSDLSDAGRRALGRGLEVLYARSGDRLLDRERPNAHLYAVRKGAVRLELDGQLVDAIGPGEVFGLTSVLGGESPSLDAVAERDCLLYRIHRDVVRALFDGEPAFADFFLQSLGSRLRALADGAPVPLSGDLGVPVGDLVSRPPVTVDVAADVLTAARRMDKERVSSVLVVERAAADGSPGRPVGILTDRDLRGRVLAAGRGPETPVREVMSSPLETMDASLPTSEALIHLLRRGIHHLPVERDGVVVGVVAHTDLLRHQRHGPGALLKKIEKAPTAASLSGYAEDVASMVESLQRGGLEATEVGRLVAALNDALISRLLDLAQRDLGSAPCDFAWIVFGSEGRQEQSFLTDQDNALIYADDGGEVAASYFPALARRAVDDLVTVGFPPCAGGFMATNWCDPRSVWIERFDQWIQRPEPEALMKAANFFDFRTVHGGLELAPLEEILERSGRQRLFIAHFARTAMEMRPPLGFLHRIREDAQGIDLKASVIMPVVGLARVFALEAGERAGSTLRRLLAAQRARIVSEEGYELLTEAFRFAFTLRLRTQLLQRRRGEEITNRIRLDDLTPAERRHLKEAFVAVHRMQSATAQRLAVDRLG